MYLLIAKGIAVLVLIATITYGVHRVLEHFREEGRVEVRSAWDAATKQANEFEAERSAAAEADARKGKEVNDARFGKLAARNLALQSRLAALVVDPLIVERLRDAVRTANQERDSAVVAASTPAVATTGVCITDWGAAVTKQYAACRAQVACLLEYGTGEKQPLCKGNAP